MRLLLAFLLTTLATASPSLRLEGGPFLPYRVNQAVAVDDEGLFGRLELLGLRWDGRRIPLFRTQVAARSQSVALVFYLDEDIRGLELQSEGPGSNATAALDLAAVGTIGAEETLLRTRMRGLKPPVHRSPEEYAPGRFVLSGSDLASAGFQASSALFGHAASRVPLLPLGAFVLAVWVIASISPAAGRRRTILRVVTAATVVTVAIAVVYLAVPKPRLFKVAFPKTGVVERKTFEWPEYTLVVYTGPEAGTVELVGFWAPLGTGIPVADVVPPGARVRFSVPPIATGEGVLVSEVFVTGWVVHAQG